MTHEARSRCGLHEKRGRDLAAELRVGEFKMTHEARSRCGLHEKRGRDLAAELRVGEFR
jgi:hypothetical protein